MPKLFLCFRQVSADGDCTLDRHPKFENIVIGVGFSGNFYVKIAVSEKRLNGYWFVHVGRGLIEKDIAFICFRTVVDFLGSGFKTSPVVGKILFQLAFGLQPSYDMKPFKIARFQKFATKSSL